MNHLNSKDMRKLSMSLLLIGMTNLGFAQYALPAFSNPFNESERAIDYLHAAQKGHTPNYAKWLEGEFADWDSDTTSKYTTDKGEYVTATFNAPRETMEVEYDTDGNIAFVKERYKNMALPNAVASNIIKLYPGWSFDQTRYTLKYNKGKATKKVFKVIIKKGNQRKRLKVEA